MNSAFQPRGSNPDSKFLVTNATDTAQLGCGMLMPTLRWVLGFIFLLGLSSVASAYNHVTRSRLTAPSLPPCITTPQGVNFHLVLPKRTFLFERLTTIYLGLDSTG